MLIGHICVLNAIKSAEIEQSYSKPDYLLSINLVSQPDLFWKKLFYREWNKIFLNKRKRPVLSGNEMKIILSHKDDIQESINTLKEIFNIINNKMIVKTNS